MLNLLNLKENRLDYGELLTPPEGYKLDFAVGTTYSLDLDALVGACLSLGLSEDTDSGLSQNPMALLEALRATTEKIALFCEAGQIHLPKKHTQLHCLLDEMVYEVALNNKDEQGNYYSFHPKFWLIRYVTKENQPLYRVITLSRNLTFDTSQDVAFSMDGKMTEEATDKNNPLRYFLNYLLKWSAGKERKAKEKKIKGMLDELSTIHFELNSKNVFCDYEFIPVGIEGYDIKDSHYSLFSDTFHEALIISPFLSKDVIKRFTNRNKRIKKWKCVLITRYESLSKLKGLNPKDIEIYTLKDRVIDGGETSEDDQDVQKHDLHAKVYLLGKKQKYTDFYLGSLNASNKALDGNIEFMIRLESTRSRLDMNRLLEDLFNGDDENVDDENNPDNPFQLVDLGNVQEEKTDESERLDPVIKDIVHLKSKAEVVQKENGYGINVSFEKRKTGKVVKYISNMNLDVKISPLLSNKWEPFGEDIEFTGLKTTELSAFYKISVSDGSETVSRVVIIHTNGIPEDRDDKIVSSFVNDKDSFFQYVLFLLGDRLALSGYVEKDRQGGNGSGNGQSVSFWDLYERMLYSAANSPDKLGEIGSLIKAVSKDGVVPEEFEETYETFEKAVNRK